jgi:hypothetical protein
MSGLNWHFGGAEHAPGVTVAALGIRGRCVIVRTEHVSPQSRCYQTPACIGI